LLLTTVGRLGDGGLERLAVGGANERQVTAICLAGTAEYSAPTPRPVDAFAAETRERDAVSQLGLI
jgi:hypothetical protein